MTSKQQADRQALLNELKNVQYNAQNEGLSQRAKEWLFDNLDRIIAALQDSQPSGDVGAVPASQAPYDTPSLFLTDEGHWVEGFIYDGDEKDFGYVAYLPLPPIPEWAQIQEPDYSKIFQERKPINLEALKKNPDEMDAPDHQSRGRYTYSLGWNDCIDHLAQRGLLRTPGETG